MCFLFYLGNLLTQENIAEVLTEVSPLIGDGDLHISQVRIALVRPLQALGPNSRNARGGDCVTVTRAVARRVKYGHVSCVLQKDRSNLSSCLRAVT